MLAKSEALAANGQLLQARDLELPPHQTANRRLI